MDWHYAVLEAGLVEQALERFRRNMPVTARLEVSARRVERPPYPDEVVREVVVNALIHRDYLLANTDVELAVCGDRLKVVSPGRLPSGITPERMRGRHEGRSESAPEGRDAGLRLLGTHGNGVAKKDCARHDGAQCDGPQTLLK